VLLWISEQQKISLFLKQSIDIIERKVAEKLDDVRDAAREAAKDVLTPVKEVIDEIKEKIDGLCDVNLP
jgi:hypothetical protein